MQIINFHGVGRPERELEPGEGPFWLGTEQFRHLLDRIAGHADRGNLAITFDDSNISDLTIALPELLKRGLSASFFVLTGRLGHPGSLAAADVAELHASGMAIGSHGVDHSDLTKLSATRLTTELAQSRAMLEEICGSEVNTFAIPFGRYNREVLHSIRRAGFSAAFTSDGGIAREQSFLKPRRSVRNQMSPQEIESALSGRLPVLKRLRRAAGMQLKQLS